MTDDIHHDALLTLAIPVTLEDDVLNFLLQHLRRILQVDRWHFLDLHDDVAFVQRRHEGLAQEWKQRRCQQQGRQRCRDHQPAMTQRLAQQRPVESFQMSHQPWRRPVAGLERVHCLLDPDSFMILFRNLVDNAFRYTPRFGTVRLSCRVDGQHGCLRLANSGPGIPVDMREQVFDRFVRLSDAGAPDSGLGLFIVKNIVAAHGAGIALKDGPDGQGLLVEIRFALAPSLDGGPAREPGSRPWRQRFSGEADDMAKPGDEARFRLPRHD